MTILLDTNVLLRLADRGSHHHAAAMQAVETLDAMNHECSIVPQVLYEYWVVATRPSESNGLGMRVKLAAVAVDHWTHCLRLFRDERGIYSYWRSLVAAHDVKGKNAHDARLVAAMQRHGLTNLLTFNKTDFGRFAGIHVFTPADILAGTVPG